jgi:hypothetical protein
MLKDEMVVNNQNGAEGCSQDLFLCVIPAPTKN